MPLSTVALLTAIVVGGLLFALGYFWRGFKGARGNYKVAKSGVPVARQGYWSSLWSLVKWSFGAVVLVAVLITWTVNDVESAADTSPAPSTSPSRPR